MTYLPDGRRISAILGSGLERDAKASDLFTYDALFVDGKLYKLDTTVLEGDESNLLSTKRLSR